MRHAGARRDEPRVVHPVDHLRALARVVVDLLVRARGEEARERVDDGHETVAGDPSGDRDHVLLGDPTLQEALRIRLLEARARDSPRRDPRRARRGRDCARPARRAPRRTPRRRTRGARVVRVPAPLSGSASSAGRRQLVLERRHGLELHRPQPGKQLVARPLEALVVGRARVPAVRAAAFAQSAAGCSMNETPRPLIVRATST